LSIAFNACVRPSAGITLQARRASKDGAKKDRACGTGRLCEADAAALAGESQGVSPPSKGAAEGGTDAAVSQARDEDASAPSFRKRSARQMAAAVLPMTNISGLVRAGSAGRDLASITD
jgi:hypothetical protein